jgi:hypothetical protein
MIKSMRCQEKKHRILLLAKNRYPKHLFICIFTNEFSISKCNSSKWAQTTEIKFLRCFHGICVF